MAVRSVLMFVAFAALVCGAELEDNELKKRGAGKTTTLNAIPTGAQKPEYTYSIYGQSSQSNPSSTYSNPSSTYSNPSSTYQTVQSSFYPSQGPSQYYTSQSTDANVQYQQQPQLNLIPPHSSSQFVPLNFVPNPGYQAKYQLIPSKTQNGNIQLAVIPQAQTFQSPTVLPFPFFSPNPGNQFSPHQPLQSQYLAQNYQLPLGNPYFGHPSAFLFAQPNPSLYQNLLYPNPVQNVYYPSNQQGKYPSLASPSSEYEKVQGSVSQSITKDDNDLSVHSSEYVSSVQPQDSYQKAYNSRNSYSKL